MNATQAHSLMPGDRVAVFTGRDYTTVANHGIVIRPADTSFSRTLVFVPHLNSYCLADDESLLRVNDGQSDRASFAEIAFTECGFNRVAGTYRRFTGNKNTFEFVQSDDGGLGFDIRAAITNDRVGMGTSHLVIRTPSSTTFDIIGCINILRQVLGLDYVKCVETKSANPG